MPAKPCRTLSANVRRVHERAARGQIFPPVLFVFVIALFFTLLLSSYAADLVSPGISPSGVSRQALNAFGVHAVARAVTQGALDEGGVRVRVTDSPYGMLNVSVSTRSALFSDLSGNASDARAFLENPARAWGTVGRVRWGNASAVWAGQDASWRETATGLTLRVQNGTNGNTRVFLNHSLALPSGLVFGVSFNAHVAFNDTAVSGVPVTVRTLNETASILADPAKSYRANVMGSQSGGLNATVQVDLLNASVWVNQSDAGWVDVNVSAAASQPLRASLVLDSRVVALSACPGGWVLPHVPDGAGAPACGTLPLPDRMLNLLAVSLPGRSAAGFNTVYVDVDGNGDFAGESDALLVSAGEFVDAPPVVLYVPAIDSAGGFVRVDVYAGQTAVTPSLRAPGVWHAA